MHLRPPLCHFGAVKKLATLEELQATRCNVLKILPLKNGKNR